MKTFAGIPEAYAKKETADIYLQSIPYDGTSTWGKGADRGFAAFLEASENMELYDIQTDSEVYKHGIHLLSEAPDFESPEAMYRYTYDRTRDLLKEEKFLTFFGGEHSISIGIIKAYYEHYSSLTVLQIDAHADLRPSYLGSPYNHACAMYDASRNANLVQVGIRSMDISEKEYMNYSQVFFADEIHFGGPWQDRAIKALTQNVYITLDLDGFDPSVLPATGTPEPGGLDWYTVTNFLSRVFAETNVVGFDIVELAPIEGQRSSEFLAAKLYYKMLSMKFSIK